jgi:predicted RNA-binding Zn-ribbon protein involved in translation (DUF1610 family)
MGWVPAGTRPSGRLTPLDPNDAEGELNAFVCEAEIRAFAIRCPVCGSPYMIGERDRRSRVFDPFTQRFHCGDCQFSAPGRLIVDCGLRARRA